jgi:photosystem II stability/assembly factor-like uncharacterized protein
MRDRRFGWAVGLAGVLSTTDGGEHWVELTRPGTDAEPTWARAVAFPDRRHGFKVGQFGELEATSDGGKNWVRQALPLEADQKPYLFDIDFPDRKHGWIVGENGTIFRTTDAGRTWKRQDTGLPDAERPPSPDGSEPGASGTGQAEAPHAGLFLTRVRFRDRLHGWTVGFWSDQGRSVVLGTRDGGATWAVETEALGEVLRALTIGSDGHAWAVGDRAGEGAQTLLARSPSK